MEPMLTGGTITMTNHRVQVMKTGWLITRNSKHVKVTPITVEQCLRDQLSKDRHTDILVDNLKHTENHPLEGDSIARTEAYLDMDALAILLNKNKVSYLETSNNASNFARMDSHIESIYRHSWQTLGRVYIIIHFFCQKEDVICGFNVVSVCMYIHLSVHIYKYIIQPANHRQHYCNQLVSYIYPVRVHLYESSP